MAFSRSENKGVLSTDARKPESAVRGGPTPLSEWGRSAPARPRLATHHVAPMHQNAARKSARREAEVTSENQAAAPRLCAWGEAGGRGVGRRPTAVCTKQKKVPGKRAGGGGGCLLKNPSRAAKIKRKKKRESPAPRASHSRRAGVVGTVVFCPG